MPDGDGRALTFSEHLEELRGRLIICLVTIVLTTCAALPLADNVLIFLTGPLQALASQPPTAEIHLTVKADGAIHAQIPPALAGQRFDLSEVPLRWEVRNASGEVFTVTQGRRPDSRLYYFSLTDPIFLILRAALLLGLGLAMPLIGWQVWLFVAPGLTARERSVIRPMIALAVLLFPLGAAFAYTLLHYAVVVLTNFAFGSMVLLPDTGRYISFVLTLMLVFGLVFEMPGLLWLLGKVGLVTSQWLARKRKIAIVAIFLTAAFLTPPDVFTQVAMGIPVVLLYELSIWLVRVTERSQAVP